MDKIVAFVCVFSIFLLVVDDKFETGCRQLLPTIVKLTIAAFLPKYLFYV